MVMHWISRIKRINVREQLFYQIELMNIKLPSSRNKCVTPARRGTAGSGGAGVTWRVGSGAIPGQPYRS